MAAESTSIKLLAGLQKHFEELNHQFTEAGDNRDKLEALNKPLATLLHDVLAEKNADLHANIQGLLFKLNRKLASVAPSATREEKKAVLSTTVAATVEHPKQRAAAKTVDSEEHEGFYTHRIFFEKGQLKEAISNIVASKIVLPAAEEKEILDAKKQLTGTVKLLEDLAKIEENRAPLRKKSLALEVTVDIYNKATGLVVKEDPAKYRAVKIKEASRWVEVLTSHASKLLHARQYVRAQAEYKAALSYSTKIRGSEDVETLTVKLNYCIALLADSTVVAASAASAALALQAVTEQLKKKVSVFEDKDSTPCKSLKKTLAIGYYNLVQHYFKKKDIDSAENFLNESEQLRKEYGASEEELDRIRYYRGMIALHRSDKDTAKEIFKVCYQFRMAKDALSGTLLPILDSMIFIMEVENNKPQQFRFLWHLLEIQKHLNFPERTIIQTQLKILKAAAYQVGEKEFWEVMDDTKERLDKIPVTAESVEVGLNYMHLADARMVFPPNQWPIARVRGYHSETLKIVLKAKAHLKAAADKTVVAEAMRRLDGLEERLKISPDFFDDPRMFAVRGRRLHPEDQAEADLLEAHETKENEDESSTLEHLASLSTFSSEIDHSLVPEADRVLTIVELNALPDEGTLNPYRLRTAQGGINSTFRDRRKLEVMRDSLIQDPNYRNEIEPIEIGIDGDKVYSFDTRRLVVHMMAKEANPNVLVRYRKITGEYLQKRIKSIATPRPWNGFVTAIRGGGKNSYSRPYLNPVYREQLGKVDGEFIYHPNDRKATGPDLTESEIDAIQNGFPVAKKKFKKIHNFFVDRAKRGSERAKEILKEAKKEYDAKGENAAGSYLRNKKAELLREKLELAIKKDDKKKQSKTEPTSAKKIPNANLWMLLKEKLTRQEEAEAKQDNDTFDHVNYDIIKIIPDLEFNRADIIAAGFSFREALNALLVYEEDVLPTKEFLKLKKALNVEIFLSGGAPAALKLSSSLPDSRPSLIPESVQHTSTTQPAVSSLLPTPVVDPTHVSNSNTVASGSAAMVGANIAGIAATIAASIAPSASGPSASRRVSEVATNYDYMDDDLIPGWQRQDGNIGRHK